MHCARLRVHAHCLPCDPRLGATSPLRPEKFHTLFEVVKEAATVAYRMVRPTCITHAEFSLLRASFFLTHQVSRGDALPAAPPVPQRWHGPHASTRPCLRAGPRGPQSVCGSAPEGPDHHSVNTPACLCRSPPRTSTSWPTPTPPWRRTTATSWVSAWTPGSWCRSSSCSLPGSVGGAPPVHACARRPACMLPTCACLHAAHMCLPACEHVRPGDHQEAAARPRQARPAAKARPRASRRQRLTSRRPSSPRRLPGVDPDPDRRRRAVRRQHQAHQPGGWRCACWPGPPRPCPQPLRRTIARRPRAAALLVSPHIVTPPPAPQVRHFTRGARVRALTPAAFWFAKPHLLLYFIKFTMFLLAFNVSNSIFFSFHFGGSSCYYAR
jgi:hypothetical protein